MALSNWDTLTVDHEGKPLRGAFTSPLGVSVEVYKNWIYIHDPKAWRGGTFCEPIVMKITEGIVRYMDVSIVALRGPQNGVFLVAWTGYREGFKGMVGCGVYGYGDDGEWLGVTTEAAKWFEDKLQQSEEVEYWFTSYTKDEEGNDIIGKVPQKIVEYELDVPECFRTISLTTASRFNQGDAFFAAHLGTDLQASVPGEQKPTIMSQMIEGMKERPSSSSASE